VEPVLQLVLLLKKEGGANFLMSCSTQTT
jgi:hypothetical protein